MNKKIKFFLYIVAGIFIVLFICSTALTYYFMMEVAGVIQRNSKSQAEIINNTENSVADQKTLIHLFLLVGKKQKMVNQPPLAPLT